MVNLLTGFAPFIAFFGLMRLDMPLAALSTAFALSGILTLHKGRLGETIKILDIGGLMLFGGLTLYTAVLYPNWSIGGVKLVVDGGLTLIAAISMVVGQPFTLQYAKERVPEEYWSTSRFLLVNQLFSGVWTLSFAIATACDAAATYVPWIPLWTEVVLSLGGLCAATWFSFGLQHRARHWVLARV